MHYVQSLERSCNWIAQINKIFLCWLLWLSWWPNSSCSLPAPAWSAPETLLSLSSGLAPPKLTFNNLHNIFSGKRYPAEKYSTKKYSAEKISFAWLTLSNSHYVFLPNILVPPSCHFMPQILVTAPLNWVTALLTNNGWKIILITGSHSWVVEITY